MNRRNPGLGWARSLPLLTALLVACGLPGDEQPAASGSADPEPTRTRDVVLVTIDTLRADVLGFAGGEADTPNLDRLAREGLQFEFAHAHAVTTLPSHASLLTGLEPFAHGVRSNGRFVLDAAIPTLATRLEADGWRTGAFVAAYPLAERFGLGRGFGTYDDELPSGGPNELVYPERPAPDVVERAVAWWREAGDQPRFLWVHLFDPHAPYEPPSPWRERFPDQPYVGEVSATDAALGPLLAEVTEGGTPALVVVTSDHGEALGEHGELTHGLFAYEATLRVPLIVWGPGIPPRVDARPVRHVDVLPTVLEALGLPAEPALPGLSLLDPETPLGPTYFESLSTNLDLGWAPLRGVLRDRQKLVELPIPELFDLHADPDESENRFESDPATARELLQHLPEASAWPPEAAVADAEATEALRALGYLGGSATPRAIYGPDDDPKRLVEIDRALNEINRRWLAGNLDGAIGLAIQVVRRRPAMPLAHTYLSRLLLEKGDRDRAVQVMVSARANGWADDELLEQLGLTLVETGFAVEAIEVLEPIAPRRDEAAITMALALAATGEQTEAEATLGVVLTRRPDSPRAHEVLGYLELGAERWTTAFDASRRALDLDAERPDAWNNLAIAAYQLGRAEEAIAAWRRASELAPGDPDVLFNLGLAAAEQGDRTTAREAMSEFLEVAPTELVTERARAQAIVDG